MTGEVQIKSRMGSSLWPWSWDWRAYLQPASVCWWVSRCVKSDNNVDHFRLLLLEVIAIFFGRTCTVPSVEAACHLCPTAQPRGDKRKETVMSTSTSRHKFWKTDILIKLIHTMQNLTKLQTTVENSVVLEKQLEKRHTSVTKAET